jgi:cytochrome c oxidase subunit 6a
MFAARSFARAAPRQALARAPARAGRRNYSSESPKQFAGAEDNEFNRERAHIAQHAAESGELWRKLSLL